MPGTLIVERCNPYGYGTDRGPRHLMGGLFGPEYAGRDLVLADGLHGIGICESRADGHYIMLCPVGHPGSVMPLCYPHVQMILRRMSGTCTACVMPPVSRELWEAQERLTAELRRAYAAQDWRARDRIQSRIEDIGAQQVELTRRGLTPHRKLALVEVS